jgi:hypothetical protein
MDNDSLSFGLWVVAALFLVYLSRPIPPLLPSQAVSFIEERALLRNTVIYLWSFVQSFFVCQLNPTAENGIGFCSRVSTIVGFIAVGRDWLI